MASKKRKGKHSAQERTLTMFEQETHSGATGICVVQTVEPEKPLGMPTELTEPQPPDPADGALLATRYAACGNHEVSKLLQSSTVVRREGDWVEYRTPGGGTAHIFDPLR